MIIIFDIYGPSAGLGICASAISGDDDLHVHAAVIHETIVKCQEMNKMLFRAATELTRPDERKAYPMLYACRARVHLTISLLLTVLGATHTQLLP